jgi:hypothetical protein
MKLMASSKCYLATLNFVVMWQKFKISELESPSEFGIAEEL